MRIVIDLQSLQTASKYRGIGRYARSLAHALLQCHGKHEIWIVVRNGPDAELNEIYSHFSDVLPSNRFFVFSLFEGINFSNQSSVWEREVSEFVRAFSLSLLSPDFVVNPSMIEGFDDDVATSSRLLLSFQNCAIIHDLIPFHDPDRYIGIEVARRWYQDKLQELLSCDLLFCNSHYTKKDFLEHLEYPEDRTHVISAASEYQLDDSIQDGDGRDIVRDLGVASGYFLYTGSLETRKNPEVLVRAFSLLPPSRRRALKIVFAGGTSTGDKERIREFARGLGSRLEDDIVFAGFLSDNDLKTLYKQCSIFVFPSLAEGFGLPVLEAMACGAPVLASNRTSLPEVVGRADLLFDPNDAISLRDKIVSILEDAGRRSDIIEYGLS